MHLTIKVEIAEVHVHVHGDQDADAAVAKIETIGAKVDKDAADLKKTVEETKKS